MSEHETPKPIDPSDRLIAKMDAMIGDVQKRIEAEQIKEGENGGRLEMWRQWARLFLTLNNVDAYGDEIDPERAAVIQGMNDDLLRDAMIEVFQERLGGLSMSLERERVVTTSLSNQLSDAHARLNVGRDQYPRMMFHVFGNTAIVRDEQEESTLPAVFAQGHALSANVPNRGWFRSKGLADQWAAENPETVGTLNGESAPDKKRGAIVATGVSQEEAQRILDAMDPETRALIGRLKSEDSTAVQDGVTMRAYETNAADPSVTKVTKLS